MRFFNKRETAIDYDKLANAIVKAQKEIDEESIKTAIIEANKEIKKEKLAEKEKLQAEWQNIIDYDEEASSFKNDMKVLKSIFCMKKENAITLVANNLLLKLSLIGFYRLLEISFYILAVISIVLAVKFYTNSLAIGFAVLTIVIGVMFARIIRIARFELENIEDKNYLASLFAAVMSFLAVIIAIVTLVVTIIIKG